MKKVIPFKKNILFKTNLSEITSISLEDNLKFDNNIVLGNFVVSGEYKMNDSSINTEPFNYDIPVEINIDEKYNLNKSTAEVSDFYYEIINNNTLNVNIEVTIDKMEEIPIIEEVRKENDLKEVNTEEVYSSYSVYIVREGDTVDSIINKYSIDKEKLQEYNDLKELKIGDKLIIPSNV